jgi:hypothetical protein
VSHDLRNTKGCHLLVLRYGEMWRALRKTVHQYFMESICEKEHMQLVDAEQVQMMRDFLVHPKGHMLHTQRTSDSIIISRMVDV